MTTTNWEVYKIFANGKMAKKPCFHFSYDDEDTVFSFFEQNVKTTFTEKQQKSKYTLLREGQSRENCVGESRSDDILLTKRQKVLQNRLKEMGQLSDYNGVLGFALVLTEETEWKWQWAAVESVTSKYLLGISPIFTKYSTAVEWVDSQF